MVLSTALNQYPVPGLLAQTHHQTEIRKRAGIADKAHRHAQSCRCFLRQITKVKMKN
jgi:hypothetical protein